MTVKNVNNHILATFRDNVQKGESLEKTVAHWAEACLHSAHFDYSEGLVDLKSAKQTYYETKLIGRIKRVFLRIFGRKIAVEKVSDWTWAGHSQNYAQSTNISEDNWSKIGLYIIAKRKSLVKQAKKAGQPILIHAERDKKLFRSLVVTPKGQIFILFNQTDKAKGSKKDYPRDAKEDDLLGKGSFNQAKIVVNFETGKKHALLTAQNIKLTDSDSNLTLNQEYKILQEIPKGPGFLPSHVLFTAPVQWKNKHNIQWASSETRIKYYLITECLDTDLRKAEEVGNKKQIAEESLEALAELHDKDILHRDLKSENIGLKDGHAYLIDLNLAVKKSQCGSYGPAGTPGYSAAWYLRAQGNPNAELTAKQDVYSMGLVLFELYTSISIEDEFSLQINDVQGSRNKAAQLGQDVQQFVHNKLNDENEIPDGLKKLIKTMVGSDPKGIPTAQEALKRFKRIAVN